MPNYGFDVNETILVKATGIDKDGFHKDLIFTDWENIPSVFGEEDPVDEPEEELQNG